jgi:restriction endonuclease Mrr
MEWVLPSPVRFDAPGAKKAPVQKGVAPTDTTKAMLDAFQFAETNRKLRASSGRAQSFNTKINPDKTLLGQ